VAVMCGMRRRMPVCFALLVLAGAMIRCQRAGSGGDRLGSDGGDYLEALAQARTATWVAGTPGGALVVGATTEPATLNPLTAADPVSADITPLLFEGMLRIDSTGRGLEPALADRWELAADGRSARVHLRDNLLWSDSVPVTVNDILHTVRLLNCTDPESRAGSAALAAACGDSIQVSVIDTQTAVIAVGEPCALLARLLTLPLLPAHVLPEPVMDRRFERFYGLRTRLDSRVVSGPFMPVSWVPGRRLVLVRNSRYYRGAAGLPYLDTVEVRIVRDHNTHLVRFQRGEIDLFAAAGKDYAVLAQDSGRQYHIHCMGPSRAGTVLLFNQNRGRDSAGEPFVDSTKLGWFRSRLFRRAVSLAIDHEAVMSSAGVSGFAQSGPVCPADTEWFEPGSGSAAYDTARARALLEQAGLRDRNADRVIEDSAGVPVAFTILVAAENLGRRTAAEQVASLLADIGMSVTVNAVEHGYLMSTLRTPPYGWEAALAGIGSSAEPLDDWEVWHSAGRFHVWDRGGVPDPGQHRIDSLLAMALREPDAARRRPIYRQWQREFAATMPAVPVFAPERILCVSSRLGNALPSVAGGMLRDAARVYRRPVAQDDTRQTLSAEAAVSPQDSAY